MTKALIFPQYLKLLIKGDYVLTKLPFSSVGIHVFSLRNYSPFTTSV